MANPMFKKNPLMSLWLSGFHTVAGTARGKAAAAARRQGAAAASQAGQAWGDLWARSIGLPPPKPPKPRKKRR